MKLPIKKKYFELIKSGKKNFEFRDAHITFICEETGEKMTCDITSAWISDDCKRLYPDVLEDNNTLVMMLKKRTD